MSGTITRITRVEAVARAAYEHVRNGSPAMLPWENLGDAIDTRQSCLRDADMFLVKFDAAQAASEDA